MIDFQNASFVKLRETNPADYDNVVRPLLIPGESVATAFRGMRDGVVFTNKRVIVINVQGMTGKKKDLTSLPYTKIQAFSIETSGVMDLDSELELWFSGLGKVRLEFTGGCNIVSLGNFLSQFVL